MKKFKNVRLMLLGALVAMGSVNAFADQTNGTFTFTISSGKATITGFAAGIFEANVVIPNEVVDMTDGKKYAVVAIDDDAFKSSKAKIESFDIQAAGVTEIQAALLSGAAKLKSVTVGSGVKKIETEAFKGTALETIDLTKATSLDDLQAGAFTGTKLTALDLSATKVTSVLNYFGTKFIGDATYSKGDANKKNVETIGNKGLTPVKKDDVASSDPGTVFANYTQVIDYYKSNSVYGDKILVAGDVPPYTKETANAANKANTTDFPGCVVAGEDVLWTEAEANAYNAALEGAMTAGQVLTDYTFSLFDAVTALHNLRKVGDAITEAEANIYNGQLPGHITAATAKEAGVQVYTVETAYNYNYDLWYGKKEGFAVEGNADPSGTALASTADAYKWNNTNVVTPAGGKVMVPGVDYDPRTASETRYTDDTAYDQNVLLAGTDAVHEGDPKPESERLAAAVNNNTLASVKLNTIWTSIADQAFENCTALTSIDFNTAAATVPSQNIGENALLGTKLTELNFIGTKVSTVKSSLFVDSYQAHPTPGKMFANSNATLTTVKFNKIFTDVPASLFENCTALKTVEFEARDIQTESAPGQPVVFKVAFNTIGAYAFANTAIESFEVPAALNAKTGLFEAVAQNAFSGCTSLKQFTYMVDNETTGIKRVIADLAFPGCTNVIYNTTNANVAAYMALGKKAPKNTTFNIVSEDGYVTPFVTTAFKKNPNKYYIKYKAVADIQVKKDEAKVYNAYLDDTDFTLNMSLYRAKNGGFYNIKAGEVVLIITNKKDLTFETASGITTGSTLGSLPNALKIVEAKEGITRAVLDYEAGVGQVIYGWVNSATAGTGFQKIATGDKFPQGTMYILAAEPADGARLNVVWRDETGAIESDPTAIESIQNVAESENGEIYNLQGVRVNGTQKGIFIKNGKKYIVK